MFVIKHLSQSGTSKELGTGNVLADLLSTAQIPFSAKSRKCWDGENLTIWANMTRTAFACLFVLASLFVCPQTKAQVNNARRSLVPAARFQNEEGSVRSQHRPLVERSDLTKDFLAELKGE